MVKRSIPSSTDPLRIAIDEAYLAFGTYRRPTWTLDACTACCMPPAMEAQLREMPLKQVTAEHFHEYNSSAKSREQDPREVGYFLPRMLELLAEGEEIHHSLEIALDRAGLCPPDSWTDEQQAALSRFAIAYFDLVLRGGRMEGAARDLPDDPLSVLLMFDIGRVEIGPLMAHWLACESPESTVRYVRTTYWDFWRDGDYTHAFAKDRDDFRQQLRAWLTAPGHRRRFTEKLLSPDFLSLAERLSRTVDSSFPMMVEGVFEQLTQ